MAQDVPTAEETKALLAVSRKRALAFGLCVGKKPDASVMILHRNKSPEILMRMAKKAGETPKVTCGKIETKGKKIKLDCAADAPPGLAKNLRRYLLTLGLKGMSVTVLDSTGSVLEEELDEEEQAAADAQAQQEGTAEEQGSTEEIASEDETAATEVAEELQELEPESETPAEVREPEADIAAQEEQKTEAMDLARRAKDLKEAASAIGGESADKLLKALGLAAQQIRASDNQRAEHMLDKIEEALKKQDNSDTLRPAAANQTGEAAANAAAAEVKNHKKELTKEFANLKPEIVRSIQLANPEHKAEMQKLVGAFGSQMKSNDMEASQATFEAFKSQIEIFDKRRMENSLRRQSGMDDLRRRTEEIVQRLEQIVVGQQKA